MEHLEKVIWCENWLKATFAKLPAGKTGIERKLLFEMAEKAGLYTPNTYGTSFSQALENLAVQCESVSNASGEFLYHAFKMPVSTMSQ